MKDQFKQIHPDAFFLDPDDPTAISEYLLAQGWRDADDPVVAVSSIGEGNMNLVVRVRTDVRKLVLKQSRPWMESHPELPAPSNRVLVEARFYEVSAKDAMLEEIHPTVVGVDVTSSLMVTEDMGEVVDYYDLYAGARLTRGELGELVDYLAALHAMTPAPDPMLRNDAMREMNHEQSFTLPLREDNGLALDLFTEGLAQEAERLRGNQELVAAVQNLGERYLAAGERLVHGDYYPGSWVRGHDGLRVLDAECAFLGPPEYDVGVMIGHMVLTSQPSPVRVLDEYEGPEGFEPKLAMGFAGVEVIRRLLGVNQLPLQLGLRQKRLMLIMATELILRPDPGLLQ
ncbi:MAG: phosphotransferase [Alphaproteobacteria bacterium]|nr:phosphotransferase [Alphaproteobacteria bacterium]